MRIQGADLRDKNRLPLRDIVPLAAPLSMYIEPANVCNIRCAFCPTGDRELIDHVGRKQGIMSEATFYKILIQLQDFGRIKHINFFKDGEPLVNRHYPEMAAELRKQCERLWTSTNALLLTSSLSDRLVAARFDMYRISIIAPHAEGYKRIAGANIDYNKLVDNIHYLFSHRDTAKIYIKMADVNLNQKEIDKFYHDFEPISDFIAVENLHGWSRTDLKDFTLGNKNDTFDGVPNVKRVVCAWPLYQMTVNWNGTVQPCNEDWSHENIMGDINKNTLKEIWNGKTFNAFRAMQLRGERWNNQACGTCWQTMSCLEDVDNCREELLERINGI